MDPISSLVVESFIWQESFCGFKLSKVWMEVNETKKGLGCWIALWTSGDAIILFLEKIKGASVKFPLVCGRNFTLPFWNGLCFVLFTQSWTRAVMALIYTSKSVSAYLSICVYLMSSFCSHLYFCKGPWCSFRQVRSMARFFFRLLMCFT